MSALHRALTHQTHRQIACPPRWNLSILCHHQVMWGTRGANLSYWQCKWKLVQVPRMASEVSGHTDSIMSVPCLQVQAINLHSLSLPLTNTLTPLTLPPTIDSKTILHNTTLFPCAENSNAHFSFYIHKTCGFLVS